MEVKNAIAKNTLFLYLRMLLSMVVSLYTVRVVLETLGTVDYGIYNVVAGVVTMFSFLSGTMASASQRFFAFELGKGNFDQLRKTFSMTLLIYIFIALLVLLLAESVGLWFLNTKMTIPEDRIDSANWVYQLSILSFMMTMFGIPYNAVIIARERMAVYAYVSIAEVILKLLLVYFLVFFAFDKLKLYALLMFLVTTLITTIYRLYCVNRFAECKFKFYWRKDLFNEIIGFSSWNLIGNVALVLREQGVNILINIFFNPAVNAARAIAFQITTVINSFVTNLQMAMNPHITKKYAANEIPEYLDTINQGARFSFFLLLFLSLPIMLETKYILQLWLGKVPEHTVNFVRLIIAGALIDTIYRTIVIGILATGKIKFLQLIVGGLNLLLLPLSYVFLKRGFPSEIVFIIAIFISVIGIFPRLLIIKKIVPSFSSKLFFKRVVVSILLVAALSFPLPFFTMRVLSGDSFLDFLTVVFSAMLSVLLIVLFVGLTKQERKFAFDKMDFYFRRFLKLN